MQRLDYGMTKPGRVVSGGKVKPVSAVQAAAGIARGQGPSRERGDRDGTTTDR